MMPPTGTLAAGTFGAANLTTVNLIQLERVVVGHHGKPVLSPVDLEVRASTFLGIIGPNGSGKTTLVRTVLGLLRPLAGRITFGAARPRFGYVPQRDAVDPSFPLTAFEITLMGRYGRLSPGSMPRAADREAALRALGEVGARELADRPFHALSGGQKQRVLIARALAGDPGVLVLDEPTTGMDLPSERATLDLIASFCRRELAVVMVSHQLTAVADHASHLCLVGGTTRPVEVGTRDEMLGSERLSRIYGQPVVVDKSNGHAVIYIDSRPGSVHRPSSAGGDGGEPA